MGLSEGVLLGAVVDIVYILHVVGCCEAQTEPLDAETQEYSV